MKRSTIAIASGAALALALGATALVTMGKPKSEGTAPPAGQAPANLVQVVHPQPAAGSDGLRLPSVAEPYAEVLVYARINGFIAEQRVDLGDRVKGGQVLATIDAPEVEREYERAKATLAQFEARLELTKRNLERTEALVGQNFLSQASLDQAQADMRVADADRNAATAEVARLAELLKFRAVRAPFSGMVTQRNVNRGELVTGDQRQDGAFLYRISQLDPLRIAVDVPQSALANIKVGSQLTVEFPEMPSETFKGRITRTAGAIDSRSGTMRVEATLPNPGGGVPGGMAGYVVIDNASQTSAFVVPVNAVVQRDGNPHVAVVADNTLRYVPVRLGRNLGQRIEAKQGLTGRESIVVNPNALLRDGDAVQIAPPQTTSK